MVLAFQPSWSPARVEAFLVKTATRDVLIDVGPGSPNRLLYVGDIDKLL